MIWWLPGATELAAKSLPGHQHPVALTHWGWVTHILVSKLTIIASDNGLSPGRRQAIIWTSAGILSIGPLGTNFSEILIETITFSFKKIRLKVSSAKWRPCCLGLNVLIYFFQNILTSASEEPISNHNCLVNFWYMNHLRNWQGNCNENISSNNDCLKKQFYSF